MGNITSSVLFKSYKSQGGRLTKDEYMAVISGFNKEVMRQIIYEGKVFDMGHHLSTIQVIRIAMKAHLQVIDWNASLKRKEEIISQGGTPFNKEKAPEGEKWFIYFNGKQEWMFKFYWKKAFCSVKNQLAYKFQPTAGKVGNKDLLTARVQDDPLAFLDFQEEKTLWKKGNFANL